MKGVRDLATPEHAELVAKVGSAIAECALAIADANGFDRQAAGVLTLRASMELLLLDAAPATVGGWLAHQAADLERLAGQGGNA